MRKKIRRVIFEELESIFNSDSEARSGEESEDDYEKSAEANAESNVDAAEVLDALELEVVEMEELMNNYKKSISFSTSIDSDIANKEKQVKVGKVSDLKDKISKKKLDIEKMKGIQSSV